MSPEYMIYYILRRKLLVAGVFQDDVQLSFTMKVYCRHGNWASAAEHKIRQCKTCRASGFFLALSNTGQNYWILTGWGRGHFFLIPRALLKLRCDHRSWNRNLSNCRFLPPQNFQVFAGIRTHGLCVSAAVLYQLTYEDPYAGSRPISRVHLYPWQEWDVKFNLNCGPQG